MEPFQPLGLWIRQPLGLWIRLRVDVVWETVLYPNSLISAIFTSADKSCLTYPYPTLGRKKKQKKKRITNNTCCQYIGCIGTHVTLSLRRCSWHPCHVTCDVNFQYGGRQRKAKSLVSGDSCIKIKHWRSKGIQEKVSIMVVRCG